MIRFAIKLIRKIQNTILNLLLMDLTETLRREILFFCLNIAFSVIETSSSSAHRKKSQCDSSSSSRTVQRVNGVLLCDCGERAICRTTRTNRNRNRGRRFGVAPTMMPPLTQTPMMMRSRIVISFYGLMMMMFLLLKMQY